MQSRIQLTVFESDKDKLTDNTSLVEEALGKALRELPFPVVSDIYHNEPDSSDAKDQPELYSGILIAGDEVMLTDFLNKDIYPVFNHLKSLDSSIKDDILNYME